MASESVDPDMSDVSGSVVGMKENGFILSPVPDNSTGRGLPYAPVDWPNSGDVWGWKVGRRKSSAGFMVDRYLIPPPRFQKFLNKKPYFASLQSLKEFIQMEFPDADQNAFFASFSWKIPAKDHHGEKDLHSKDVVTERSGPELHISMSCKARNKICGFELEARSSSLPAMDCNVCCIESGFCRDCCCILCSRSIDWAYGGYSFIRCEANASETSICGHAAHIDCALRSYMAGTVGGSIGLDAEYYCRRCDARTDLISHVTRLLKTCESLDSRDDIEKILKMGLCILRGSQRENALRLLNCIQLAFTKLKSGIPPKAVWNMVRSTSRISAGSTPRLGKNGTLSCLEGSSGRDIHRRSHMISELEIESCKLDDEIEQVLEDLRRSQELEYRMAEDRLNAKKHLLVALHQQLEQDRSALAERTTSTTDYHLDSFVSNITCRLNQIKQEAVKLKDLEQVAKGFGKTPTSILKEHFGFQTDY